ncbi:hypothetical protein [Magnetospirillum sp. UT-4]|uniref:hypothetical protein n=1 Tax=Magnetospirillum sp. UT-4 TaxID=2681467 RepID=UPI001383DBF9|nr:hypothetical protein [Magnetospirillum sp. UT-4]CAA7621138.1 conserved hypothetical protein [Magnetospirillum sp. UT-4]
MNPILIVKDAGHGTAPPCPAAKFGPGDVVKVRRRAHLKHLPGQAAIAVVVPPGFPAEHALADARHEPRPLMTTIPSRSITYIVAFDGNPTPHLLRETDLIATGLPKVPVGWADEPAIDASMEASA